MSKMLQGQSGQNAILFFNRIALGLYLGFAGIEKLKGGIGDFYTESFLALKPDWLIEPIARPYGYAIPFLEMILGLFLIIGLFGRLTAALAAFMIMTFTVALINQFGIAAQAGDGGGPFSANYLIIGQALMLASLGAGRLGVDGIWGSVD